MALVTPGNNYQVDLQASSGGSVAMTTTNKYVVNPVTTFKGNSATETVVDTNVLSGAGVGTVTQVKAYSALTGSTYSTYGTVASATFPGIGSFNTTIYFSPPIQQPLNLTAGQSYSINYTQKTEISSAFIPAVADVNVAYTLKFVGKESVTTPAGSYMTCKMETTTVASGVTNVGTSWVVAEGRYKGLPLKSDDGKGNTSVATKLLFKGS